MLSRKLQLKPGYKMAIINAPDGYNQLLGELPEGVSLSKRAKGDCDLVHLFAGSRAELNRHLPRAIKALKHDAIFWISYPKKSSGVKTDINRDQGWEPLNRLKLRLSELVRR